MNASFTQNNWEAFAKVLPKQRHKVGKTQTATIERDNSNMRHHLGRFTRRTKIVSKRVEMVDNAIKLWCALTEPEIFARYQQMALSILYVKTLLFTFNKRQGGRSQ